MTEPSDLFFIFIFFIFIFFFFIFTLVSPVGSLVRHNFATMLPQNYLNAATMLPQFAPMLYLPQGNGACGHPPRPQGRVTAKGY